MPLRVADATVTPEALKEAKETYLIFYSSPDSNGRLWCPDCRDVEGLVKGTFEPKDGPSGVIVYVGQKAEWKTPANAFRGEPWRVTGVPTIIKLRDVARLVDNEITSRLTSFVEE
ncbi:hypothetical protein PLICRDRAFT_100806 [Plicaturopsis crispa FD-325 SS-3]|nr:hypothetical protein PLICRDRAFT_100806 [Plicaturopsis crispa FD-325 SS-3]